LSAKRDAADTHNQADQKKSWHIRILSTYRNGLCSRDTLWTMVATAGWPARDDLIPLRHATASIDCQYWVI
jgi:hypothetical protein